MLACVLQRLALSSDSAEAAQLGELRGSGPACHRNGRSSVTLAYKIAAGSGDLVRRVVVTWVGHRLIIFEFVPRSSETEAVAVAFSMAWDAEVVEQPGADAVGWLTAFRRDVYACLLRRADALFELGDAVLTAGPVPSLPYLSVEPVFRRSWGMAYQGLAEGRVDAEALRDALVA